jgi:hypothetical protein
LDIQELKNVLAEAGSPNHKGDYLVVVGWLNDLVDGPNRSQLLCESELMACLGPQSFAAVFDHPRFSELKRDVESQNLAGVGIWANAFCLRGLIAEQEKDAVLDLLARTVTPKVRRAEVLGLLGPGEPVPAELIKRAIAN